MKTQFLVGFLALVCAFPVMAARGGNVGSAFTAESSEADLEVLSALQLAISNSKLSCTDNPLMQGPFDVGTKVNFMAEIQHFPKELQLIRREVANGTRLEFSTRRFRGSALVAQDGRTVLAFKGQVFTIDQRTSNLGTILQPQYQNTQQLVQIDETICK